MPYWRLSSFYFFYFAALGALVPFWGIYLQSLGFDALAIGQLMAILMATKIVGPYLWGWLADHLGQHIKIVQVASFLAVVIFTGMFWVTDFWWIALVMILFSFFWNASLPQLEVVTFAYLVTQVRRYAKIRLWGSVGFILSVVALGLLVDKQGPAVILSAVLILFAGIWLASLTIRDPVPEASVAEKGSLLSVLLKPSILAFFLVVFLMQMSHGPYYAFFSIYLDDLGYSKVLIGELWALGVLAEVMLFMLMHHLLLHWSARLVLLLSLLIASLRWLLIGYFADVLWILILAQLLHAATFGSFHAAAIHLVHHYFKGQFKGRGQALYSSLSFGAGGASGSLISGMTWESQGPVMTYSLAAFIALLASFLAWQFIDSKQDF